MMILGIFVVPKLLGNTLKKKYVPLFSINRLEISQSLYSLDYVIANFLKDNNKYILRKHKQMFHPCKQYNILSTMYLMASFHKDVL